MPYVKVKVRKRRSPKRLILLERRRAAQLAAQEKRKDRKRWDEEALLADEVKVIRFCEHLSITSGPDAGELLRLRSWQRRFIEAIYQTDESGKRRTRTAILSMGRKNGKTQLAAALALCHLSGPMMEARGEVYCCANDRFQASKLFNEMVAMIDGYPFLKARCKIIAHRKEIEDIKNGSRFAALSREARTKMGLNPSFVVYDELGQTGESNLYDAMDTAMGARAQPLLLVISTQAADDFAPMSRLVDYGLKVKEGEITDPAFHLTLYAAPEDANPWSKQTWEKANPALNDFLSLDHVERMARQAQAMPSRENAFRNLILNQRVAGDSKFMNRAAWRACGVAPKIPEGARVFAGLDLGATRDLSALVIVWGDEEGAYHVVPYCWIPGELEQRSQEDRLPYVAWVKQGFLMPIGPATDPAVIAHKIAEINARNKITALAFDRWHIGDLKRELDKIGCGVVLEPHGQGYKDMAPAVSVTERLISQHKIRHGEHPVLTACAHNAIVTLDPAANRKFDKAKSTGRIDALVAMAMALNVAMCRQKKAIDVEALIG